MNGSQLQNRIEALIDGSISPEDHQTLQHALKADAVLRAQFRERMDLEAGLRTWAAQDPSRATDGALRAASSHDRKRRGRLWRLGVAAAAVALVVVILFARRPPARSNRDSLDTHVPQVADQALSQLVGRLIEDPEAVWESEPVRQAGRIGAGELSLVSGIVEVRFDSGTNLIIEGPCALDVESGDTARLVSGKVFVDVTEVSQGFVLKTPDARIIDEGTQYAVALDHEAAEVHVFDGSVLWIPDRGDTGFEDRVESGEAKRYPRSEPAAPRRVPFGQRQFVRKRESRVRESGGEALVAYDGFENVAGQLRRGRSGFGWAGGWQSGRRGRGPLATVVDAPDDVVFGFERRGTRLLSLTNGDNLRRALEKPPELNSGTALFVGVLVSRQSRDGEAGHSVQITLEPESDSRRSAKGGVSFGITSEGFPFINSAGSIEQTAAKLPDGETCLCVFRYAADSPDEVVSLRVYRAEEAVDVEEPSRWTVSGPASFHTERVAAVRLSVGRQASWHVDELRIGTSWNAVTAD